MKKLCLFILLLTSHSCSQADCEIAVINGWSMKKSDAKAINSALLPRLPDAAGSRLAVDVVLSALENGQKIDPIDGKLLILGYRSHLASLEKRKVNIVSHFDSLKQKYDVKIGLCYVPIDGSK